MVRWLVLASLVACEVAPIERLGLRSECEDGDRDAMHATIDGKPLCARARLSTNRERPSGTEEIITPGSFVVAIDAPLTAGDGTLYHLAIGLGQQTWIERRDRLVSSIDPHPPLRSDKSDIHRGGWASLRISYPLDLPIRTAEEWIFAKGGIVTFDHYDLTAGTSGGTFEVVFEARSSALETKRLIHARGSFQTATPIIDDDGILSADAP